MPVALAARSRSLGTRVKLLPCALTVPTIACGENAAVSRQAVLRVEGKRAALVAGGFAVPIVTERSVLVGGVERLTDALERRRVPGTVVGELVIVSARSTGLFARDLHLCVMRIGSGSGVSQTPAALPRKHPRNTRLWHRHSSPNHTVRGCVWPVFSPVGSADAPIPAVRRASAGFRSDGYAAGPLELRRYEDCATVASTRLILRRKPLAAIVRPHPAGSAGSSGVPDEPGRLRGALSQFCAANSCDRNARLSSSLHYNLADWTYRGHF